MIENRRALSRFADGYLKQAASALETESVRAYRASDTARRLPGARSGIGSGVPSYSAPNPPSSQTMDSTSGVRAVPPPPAL